MPKPKAAAPAAKSASFSTEFLDTINTTLLSEKKRLENDISKFAKPNPHTVEENFDSKFPNYGDKDDENAAEVAEYAANVSIEQDLEKTLRDINVGLERLKKGTYGICKYCKKPIEQKRLLARPTSSACVECKKAITQEV